MWATAKDQVIRVNLVQLQQFYYLTQLLLPLLRCIKSFERPLMAFLALAAKASSNLRQPLMAFDGLFCKNLAADFEFVMALFLIVIYYVEN